MPLRPRRQHSPYGVTMGIAVSLSVVSVCAVRADGADWLGFRGTRGDGHSPETQFPITWSEDRNVVWKIAVPGLGWSSPVIQADRIWLTTAGGDGRSLRVLCYHRAGGRMLHDTEVFRLADPGPIHSKNSHASPTPVLEADRVYVHFGAHGTACLSSDGRIIWKIDGWNYNHRHGPAGSPVLYHDLLIFSCDGTDVQFVVALDKATGKIRWKQPRDGPMAYATPLLMRADGADQLVSPGGNQVISYDPRTGTELWRYRYVGFSVVPRPVHGHGLVFFSSGFNQAELFAVRHVGRGDVTDTHLGWRRTRGAPHTPSPLLVGDELYVVSDRGIASCLDARTGRQHWQERIGGGFSASPVCADGKIFLLNEEGVTTVIAAGKTFRKLAANELDGRTLASIAISDGSLFIRSQHHLYRIGETNAKREKP